jgi:hypothetical protein
VSAARGGARLAGERTRGHAREHRRGARKHGRGNERAREDERTRLHLVQSVPGPSGPVRIQGCGAGRRWACSLRRCSLVVMTDPTVESGTGPRRFRCRAAPVLDGRSGARHARRYRPGACERPPFNKGGTVRAVQAAHVYTARHEERHRIYSVRRHRPPRFTRHGTHAHATCHASAPGALAGRPTAGRVLRGPSRGALGPAAAHRAGPRVAWGPHAHMA